MLMRFIHFVPLRLPELLFEINIMTQGLHRGQRQHINQSKIQIFKTRVPT
jgi:hypothetical protein